MTEDTFLYEFKLRSSASTTYKLELKPRSIYEAAYIQLIDSDPYEGTYVKMTADEATELGNKLIAAATQLRTCHGRLKKDRSKKKE